MNLEKIFENEERLQKELSFKEISKLYREILYNQYKNLEDGDSIHCYQLLRDTIDIFTQMTEGRKFDKDYLKETLKW